MSYETANPASDWNTIIEPISSANTANSPTFPYCNGIQTESGHSFEMDDTTDRERIRIHHRSNTFIEMHPNGDEVHKIYGDGYEIVLKNKKVLVEGSCTVVVNGNAAVKVKGDSFTSIEGNCTQTVEGDCNISSKGDLSISASEKLRLSSSEDIEYYCKNFNITGSLFVRGDIRSEQTIYSQGNISTGSSLYSTIGIFTMGIICCGPQTTRAFSLLCGEICPPLLVGWIFADTNVGVGVIPECTLLLACSY